MQAVAREIPLEVFGFKNATSQASALSKAGLARIPVSLVSFLANFALYCSNVSGTIPSNFALLLCNW